MVKKKERIILFGTLRVTDVEKFWFCVLEVTSTQTKTSGQKSGSVPEAENIWPSSELALSKLVHFSEGQLASMFIGLF